MRIQTYTIKYIRNLTLPDNVFDVRLKKESWNNASTTVLGSKVH